MAAGTKLNIVFNNSLGSTTSYTWNYAKPSATAQQVTALITAMVTNTDILASKLISAKSAKLITTSETEFDLEATATAEQMKYIERHTIEGNPDRTITGTSVKIR